MAKRRYSLIQDIPSPPADDSSPPLPSTCYYMPPSPCPSQPMSEMELFLWECLNTPETMQCAIVNDVGSDKGGAVSAANWEIDQPDLDCARDAAPSNWSTIAEVKSQSSPNLQPALGLIFRMTPERQPDKIILKETFSDPLRQNSMLSGAGSWCEDNKKLNKCHTSESSAVNLSLESLEEDLRACSIETAGQAATETTLSDNIARHNHPRKARKLDKSDKKTRGKR